MFVGLEGLPCIVGPTDIFMLQAVTFGCEMAIMFGGVVPYIPQYIQIKKNQTTQVQSSIMFGGVVPYIPQYIQIKKNQTTQVQSKVV